MGARIYLGTSGYNYRYWVGRFYPRGTPASEQLAVYARHFNSVEINTSYFGIPSARVLERMAEQTPASFQFSVKAFQGITHQAGVDEGVCAQFDQALVPLRERGQLAVILFQFPNAFRPTRDTVDKLMRLRELYPRDKVVMEFRHIAWLDRAHLERLRSADMGWCSVDEPRLKGLLPRIPVATNGDGYVRFHGRNSDSWYSGDGQQRYNYLYRERQLRSWLGGLIKLSASTQRLFVFLNNCYLGHAAKNAVVVAELLRRHGLEVSGGG